MLEYLLLFWSLQKPMLVELMPRKSLEEDKPHTGEEFGFSER